MNVVISAEYSEKPAVYRGMISETASNWIHPFQRAGLGVAPYRVTGYTVAKFQACQGAPVQCGSSCDVCGTGIMHVFTISSADGVAFKVGSDCVLKTGDTGLQAGMRQARYEFVNREYLAAKRASAAERAARDAERAVAKAKLADEMAVTYAAGLEALFMLSATTKSDWLRGRAMYFASALLDGRGVPEMKWYDRTGVEHDIEPALWIGFARSTMPPSKYVGEVGKRMRGIVATVSHVPTFEGAYGTVCIYNMITDAGEVLVWKTNTGNAGKPGDRITLTGTVKRHSEYNGEKQTELSRCKVQP